MKAAITGHRKFRNKLIFSGVKKTLDQILTANDISYGYTCLAPGADEMFAASLRDAKIRYTALIPCRGYDQTFTRSQLKIYKASLTKARFITRLRYSKPVDLAFYEAGKIIVDKSDLLIAVWDGKKAKGLGGTADVVAYALLKSKKVIHINIQSKK